MEAPQKASLRQHGEHELQAVLPRNFLRACLLLLLRERPDHGYELLDRLASLGVDWEEPGGMYRALRLMERDGLVCSDWASSASGPHRRTYTVTAMGEEALRCFGHALDDCRRAIEGYLDRFLDLVEPVEPAHGNGSNGNGNGSNGNGHGLRP